MYFLTIPTEVVVRAIEGVVVLAVLAAVLVPAGLESQTVLERAKQRARERVERQTDAAIEKTLDTAENAVACVATDAACVEAAQAQGQEVVLTDGAGKPLPAGEQPGPSRVGEGAWANYDFVPGERVLLFEDFTRDRVGNFPQRLELVTGSSEVVEWQGRRWLRMNGHTAFQVPLPEVLPERFTVEFDLPVPWHGMLFYAEPFTGYPARSSSILVSGTETGVFRNMGSPGKSTADPRTVFGAGMFDADWVATRVHRVSMQVDGKYVKLYLDERRLGNMPNAEFGRANYLVFEFIDHGGGHPLITNITVSADGSRMYDALMADGRVSTRGILFGTGSDVIRPESTPTLNEIGEMLKQHADLRLLIEGHTDNVGDGVANQTLSERRAAAVRTHLIAAFGIEASRLEARGLGASRPADSNDSSEGRQNNRRVELIRL
jgi:OmpA-OmpF porin, OOP family